MPVKTVKTKGNAMQKSKKCHILLFLAFFALTPSASPTPTPTEVATLVATGLVTAATFIVAADTVVNFATSKFQKNAYSPNPLMPDSVKTVVNAKTQSLGKNSSRYLSIVSKYPWKQTNPETPSLKEVEESLNASHFGLNKVKQSIINTLAVQQVLPEAKNKIMCLVGPPGVGKTTISQAIAKALHRGFYAINAASGEETLRGTAMKYVGSEPGAFAKAILTTQVTNPVVLLDEIDKVSHDGLLALLEAFDPERNTLFHDAFLDFGVDLSDVYFIATANNMEKIPLALRDRMEVIHIDAYSSEEKAEIGRQFSIPKLTKNANLPETTIAQLHDIVPQLITLVSKSKDGSDGVRNMERALKDLVARQIKHILTTGEPFSLTSETLKNHVDPYFTQLRLSEPADVQTYCNTLLKNADIPTEIFKKIENKVSDFTLYKGAPALTSTYIEAVVQFPFNKTTTPQMTLCSAMEQLNATHYGLVDAKEAILDGLASLNTNNETFQKTLCLIGAPGVGKTTFAESIATALCKKSHKISLASLSTLSSKNSRNGGPGALAKALITTGVCDPVIILEDLHAAHKEVLLELLEVFHASINKNIYDKYLGFDIDLSRVTFITTATSLQDVPYALRNNMRVICMPPYSNKERLEIGSTKLIPKLVQKMNLGQGQQEHLKNLLQPLVEPLVEKMMRIEHGVSVLNRSLMLAAEKYARQLQSQETPLSPEITKISATDILIALNPEFLQLNPADSANSSDCVGRANGMYATEAGSGGLFKFEALVIPHGKGSLRPNRLLGDSAIEAQNRVFAYVKSIADSYQISPLLLQTSDFMFGDQVYEQSDGPSGGIAQATALISALTGRTVKQNFAVTGAIDMHGNALPVGGYKAKIVGTAQAGIKNIIVPTCSRPTIEAIRKDFPDLTIFYVSTVPEALELLLNPAS